ncbi:nonsense-mediated mRNA decay factor SMG9-like isoform X1 [Asterias amurensis]|uniref:nonsense-mediated mRNA decay factor SMG9-like isoform X1 n=1 Tax=Asterias amurensis TaxID=7602 RepID=UPI003AB69E8B
MSSKVPGGIVGGASGSSTGGARRRRRRGRSKTQEDLRDETSSPQLSKPTIILAKSTASQPQSKSDLYGSSPEPGGASLSSQTGEPAKSTPQFKIKARPSECTPYKPIPTFPQANSSSMNYQSPVTTAIYASSPSQGDAGQSGAGSYSAASKPAGQVTRPLGQSSATPVFTIEVPVHNRLTAPPDMKQSVKLVDDNLQWCDNGMEMLLDHTDFLVVGVLGLQGSGKSTLMSILAGSSVSDNKSPYIFKPQTREIRNQSMHQTTGIDFYVTNERVMILDTQPVLSSSVMDSLMSHEKSLPPDVTSAENCNEIQSLQLASFLLTVCHVVLIVQDWFLDINLVEFLKRAEMLKPPTPSPSPALEGSNNEETEDFFPNVVFVLNKARQEDFQVTAVQSMQESIAKLFKDSKLTLQGTASVAHTKLLPGLNRKNLPLDVNLFVLPRFDKTPAENSSSEDHSILLSLLPVSYQGHPSVELLTKAFRNQIYGAARTSLTHTSLTEKNWFHYAARTWEAIKKSSLMSEFNRLLT